MISLKKVYRFFPPTVWGITLILVLFVIRKTILNVARGETNVSASIDSNSSLGILALGLSLMILLFNNKCLSAIYRRCGSFASYYIFALISAFWAGGSLGGVVYKGLEMLLSYLLVCLAIYKIGNFKKAIDYLLILCFIVTFFDYYYYYQNFRTLIMHTNTFTISAMIGFVLCVSAIRIKLYNSKQIWFPLLFFGFVLIAGTSSASYIATILGLFVMFSIKGKRINYLKMIFVAILIYCVFDFLYPYITEYIFVGHTEENIESGSGRSEIWAACMASWSDSPILGHGFVIGEKTLQDYGSFAVRSAHNAFLSVLVNTGVIGLVFFLRPIIKLLKLTTKSNKYTLLFLPVSVAVIINVCSCPIIGSDWYPESLCAFALFAISFLFLIPKKQTYESSLL